MVTPAFTKFISSIGKLLSNYIKQTESVYSSTILTYMTILVCLTISIMTKWACMTLLIYMTELIF